MARLFVSADLPEEAREMLAEISSGLPGAAWVPPEQLHLTLKFIGEVDNGFLPEIRRALDTVHTRSFYLSLKGLGHFPLRGNPEVLWAGVRPNDELLRLRKKIETTLTGRGLPPDTRKFHPHVTLARIRSADSEYVGQYLAGNSLFSMPEIPVQGFSLYASTLTPDGAVHHLEGSYPLEGLLEAE